MVSHRTEGTTVAELGDDEVSGNAPLLNSCVAGRAATKRVLLETNVDLQSGASGLSMFTRVMELIIDSRPDVQRSLTCDDLGVELVG